MVFHSRAGAMAMYAEISACTADPTRPLGKLEDDEGWMFGFRLNLIEAMVVRR